MENGLFGKTIIWNGDSICAGTEEKGNWASRIAKKNGMSFKNYAVGGGTIAQGFPICQGGQIRHSVLETIDTMYKEFPDADFIVFEGGTNDADLIERGDAPGLSLGGYDPENFSGDYDLKTFAGCLETLFYKALKFWNGKKICYIVAQKMGTLPNQRRKRRIYFDMAVKICKKWGIPYIDLWEGCYLNPSLPNMYDPSKTPEENNAENKGYYVDGQHLTKRGYDFTSEIIERFLNTL